MQSARELILQRFVVQQDNDPKYKANNDVEWPSQSPVVSPTENLCLDMNRAVHSQYSRSQTELELFCKEKIAVSRCAKAD